MILQKQAKDVVQRNWNREFFKTPISIEHTGLPFIFILELVAKNIFLRGQIHLVELAYHLRLPIGVLQPIVAFLRTEKLCEVNRQGSSGTDADISYKLTDNGRTRATEYLTRNAYIGPAPVTLHDYCFQVQAQLITSKNILREDITREFENTVVKPQVLVQLGAAMNSGRSVFIHGPAGSGKTFIAERLVDLLKGDIWVPHAVMVDGEVIQVYDPAIHHEIFSGMPQSSLLDKRDAPDPRWVRCRRPAVLTGGELTLNMLELQFDPATRYYQAPPHLKANNGIFIIDDLGRQRCSPVELMNRWIVPLDRRMDHLTLHTGHKFTVPFDVVVIFSSNFPPAQLGDGALLRRLGYKIAVGEQTEAQYERIFRGVCKQYGVPYSDDAFRYMVNELHARDGRPLLACYPGDIVSQVRDLARYESREPVLDRQVLDWAWNNYFTGN